jgi:hypothetical protein
MEDVKKELISSVSSEMEPTETIESIKSKVVSASPTDQKISAPVNMTAVPVGTPTTLPTRSPESQKEESIFKNILKRLSLLEKNTTSFSQAVERIKTEVDKFLQTELRNLKRDWGDALKLQVK